MASKGKGKEVLSNNGKRKRKDSNGGDDEDKVGKNRRNREVLKFFDDAAAEIDDDEDEDSDIGDDFIDAILNDYQAEAQEFPQSGRSNPVPFLPKEEELSGDELEKFLEERYRRGSGFVRYAGDAFETKATAAGAFALPSIQDSPLWKVKCKVGREKNTVFCLMQKFADLKLTGKSLQIISAFAVEHVKGFVFIEGAKQSDVSEACWQLADVYHSLVALVPKNEVSNLLTVKKKHSEVRVGMWARVKSGIYKGDLAQVVAVNDLRKRATVQLVPRIDLQALAGKFGGAASAKRTAVPAARLISSSELEELRPLIHYRRDRDTGKFVEVLDGLMLKDGFLYKRISIDSLTFWDVNPTEDELQKLSVSTNDKSNNLEWLSQLYGEQKKKRSLKSDKGDGKGGGKGGGKGSEKGEGCSSSGVQDGYEIHDLVVFGKKDFGMIIGMEKDEYKILIDGSEGPTVVTHGAKSLKLVESDTKFTAADRRSKVISHNDTVRVLDGAAKGRQGIVKQIYRGIVFLYDQNELESDPYFCVKSHLSEKVKRTEDVCLGKGGDDGGPSGFGDFSSSPKSPLSPEKPWESKENNRDSNQRDKDGLFSVGQTLRIKIGPLKGYLCRVLAIRYADITVKLASQQKVLTVKSEHLAEIRPKGFGTSSDHTESSSLKPFDLLGTEGGSNDWAQGASGAADIGGWNSGTLSTERSGWAPFPSSSSSLQLGTDSANPSDPAEASGWQTKVDSSDNSAWGKAVEEKAAPDDTQSGGWGTAAGSQVKISTDEGSGGWGSAKASIAEESGSWKDGGSSWGKGKSEAAGASGSWGNDVSLEKGQAENKAGSSWDNKVSSSQDQGSPGASAWGQKKSLDSENASASNPNDPWGKAKGSQGKDDSNAAEKSSGDASEKWGNKRYTSEGKDWKSMNTRHDSLSGWGAGGSAADGWGKTVSAYANPGGSWNNSDKGEGAGGWNTSGGGSQWGQPKNGEDDEGFNGGRGSGGRRGRGGFRGGRSEGGRGRDFGAGQSSSWNNQDISSDDSFGGSGNQGGGLGKDKGWNSGGGEAGGWRRGKSSTEDNALSGKAGWTACGQTCGSNSWSGGGVTAQDSSNWGKGSADQASGVNADDTWAKAGSSAAKETSNLPDDAWGKAANTWGNKDSSSGSKAWKSPTAAPESQGGGWGESGSKAGKSQEENASGGWNKAAGTGTGTGTGDNPKGKWGAGDWSKPKAFDDDSAPSWGTSVGSEDDGQGFGGGRGFCGRKGRGGFRGGRDQFGGGRGRSFGRGDFSSGNKDGDDGSFGNNGQSSWGKDKPGGSWGEKSGGNSSWGNDKPASTGGSWGSQSEPRSSWGNDKPGNQGGNRSWGNDKPVSTGGSWGSQSETRSCWGNDKPVNQGGNWGSKSDGNNDLGKDKGWNSGGGDNNRGGGWGKHKSSENEAGGVEGWKKQEPSFGGTGSSGQGGWGASRNSGNQTSATTVGTESQGGGWGKGAGILGKAPEENALDGWNKKENAGGWGGGAQKDGGSSQGQTETWSKPSWNSSSGGGSTQSNDGDDDSGFGGGRGSGGRGRGGFQGDGDGRGFRGGRDGGGFRGGRDGGGFRGGRDGGGSRGGRVGGRFSSWNNDSQDGGGSSWGGSSGRNNGGGGRWGKEGNSVGGGSSWGGSAGGSNGQGGGGWGKSGGSNDGGGSSWGSSSGGGNGEGGDGWSQGGNRGGKDDQGVGWGKSKGWNSDGGNSGTSVEKNNGGGGWGGGSSGGKNDQEGGLGKAKGWQNDGGSSGNASDAEGNGDQGRGWGKSSGKNWGSSSGGGGGGGGWD
ncbi:RNA-directed DNA methylation 3-like protein [Drosera capensis]